VADTRGWREWRSLMFGSESGRMVLDLLWRSREPCLSDWRLSLEKSIELVSHSLGGTERLSSS
jgi:hypothetical protein